jgi:putative transposase
MPRRPRVNLAGYSQHVVQRGHNREACFYVEEDYRFYLHWLEEAAKKYGCDIHAYVLMTNHVHLLVTPHTPSSLARLMQSLGRRYAQYVNRFYARSGSVWEGRYRASLIQAEEYLLTCYRYIEMNPVRANMVRDAGEYRWSSHRRNGFGEDNPILVDHPLYVGLGSTPGQRVAAYRTLFQTNLDDAALKEIQDTTNKGLPLGSGRFSEQVEAALGKRVSLRRRGRHDDANTSSTLPGQMGLDV